jgi:hypothetical protein
LGKRVDFLNRQALKGRKPKGASLRRIDGGNIVNLASGDGANREIPLKAGERPREDARKGKPLLLNRGGGGKAEENLKGQGEIPRPKRRIQNQ